MPSGLELFAGVLQLIGLPAVLFAVGSEGPKADLLVGLLVLGWIADWWTGRGAEQASVPRPEWLPFTAATVGAVSGAALAWSAGGGWPARFFALLLGAAIVVNVANWSLVGRYMRNGQ